MRLIKRFMQGAALALAVATLPACAKTPPATTRAANDADPALWVVRDRDTTIYLFGTIHVLRPGLTWFDEAVRQAFDRSDELKLEIVEPEAATMQGLIQRQGMLHDAPTLTQRLPAKERPVLARYMGQLGMPVAAYDRMQPWLAATMLQVQSLQRVGYDPASGPETVLTAAAKAAGKPVSGLETVEQQIGFLCKPVVARAGGDAGRDAGRDADAATFDGADGRPMVARADDADRARAERWADPVARDDARAAGRSQQALGGLDQGAAGAARQRVHRGGGGASGRADERAGGAGAARREGGAGGVLETKPLPLGGEGWVRDELAKCAGRR